MSHVEFDYNEFDLLRVEGSIEAHGRETREELQAGMRAAVEAAHGVMLLEGPRATGEMLANIEIQFGALVYNPGGFGGGGDYVWEARLTIDEDRAPQIRFVFEGTGRFGPHHSDIKPASGNIMNFRDEGQEVFARYTQGQRPQQEWVENAMRAAESVLDGIIAVH